MQLVLDYAAAGGLLITAVHIQSCANALGYVLRRYFWNRRQEAADLFRMVVAPRRLFMVCMHCAEEVRVPAKILVEAGMAEPPAAGTAASPPGAAAAAPSVSRAASSAPSPSTSCSICKGK